MRILIIAENEHFFIPDMIREFLDICGEDIVGIAIADDPVLKPLEILQWKYRSFRKKTAIMTSYDMFKLSCRLLKMYINGIFTRRLPTLRAVAAEKGIACFHLKNVNSPVSLSKIKNIEPDLIISVQDQIFGKELLEIPKLGCINKHAALLPEYKGVWPVFWAMLNNESQTGLTIHWIDSGVDTGRIIVQRPVPINQGDSMYDLYRKIFALCAVSLNEAVAMIKENPSGGTVQRKGCYFSFPDRASVLRFRQKGDSVI